MANRILILNGPNLNLLGIREPEVYGTTKLDELIATLKAAYSDHQLTHHQSNHEGVLIDKIHEYGFSADGIILNPGAYTHTSIALRDAISAVTTPVVEVHLSDISQRESFRQKSFITDVCAHHVMGKGPQGYHEAVDFIIQHAGKLS